MNNIHNQSPKRITSQQQAIFHIIKKSRKHLTVDDVYTEVVREMPRISLATVYRNLDKLFQSKLIGRTIINGLKYYELSTDEHYHVLCLSCRTVSNINSIPASDIEEFFGRSTDFKLTGHDLLLYGICPNCQRPG